MANFISNAFMLPNDLIDKGFMAQMKGAALPCYLFIVRKTRGWNKIDDDISISQLIDGTGYKKDAILAGLEILLKMGIIEKITYQNRASNFTLTDNVIAVGKTDTEESTVGNTDTKSGSGVGNTDKLGSEKPTHNNNIKTNTKTKGNYSEDFEVFWNAYPTCKRKSDKSGTFKTFEKHIRVISLEKLIAVLNAHKLDSSWIKNDGEFIPAPSAWLNKKHWENDFWLKAAGLVEQKPESSELPDFANQQRRVPTVPKRFKGMNA